MSQHDKSFKHKHDCRLRHLGLVRYYCYWGQGGGFRDHPNTLYF